MNQRRILAGMLGLAVAGCAQTRATQTQAAKGLPPVGMASLPSIHEMINGGLERPGEDIRLAGRAPDPTKTPGLASPEETQMLADVGQPPAAEAEPEAPAEVAAERPAPYAGQAPRTGRPQAARRDVAANARPAMPGPEAESTENGASPPAVASAPAQAAPVEPKPADVASAAPGASDESSPITPTTESVAAAGPGGRPSVPGGEAVAGPVGVDPSLGPNPDVMPPIEMPRDAVATGTKPVSAEPSRGPETGLMTAGAVGIDPALGPNPDVMPPAPATLPRPATNPNAPPALEAGPVGVDPALGPNPDVMPPLDLKPLPPRTSPKPEEKAPASTEKPAATLPVVEAPPPAEPAPRLAPAESAPPMELPPASEPPPATLPPAAETPAPAPQPLPAEPPAEKASEPAPKPDPGAPAELPPLPPGSDDPMPAPATQAKPADAPAAGLPPLPPEQPPMTLPPLPAEQPAPRDGALPPLPPEQPPAELPPLPPGSQAATAPPQTLNLPEAANAVVLTSNYSAPGSGQTQPPTVRAPEPPAPVDPAVRTAAATSEDMSKAPARPRTPGQTSRIAARVDDEVITEGDLIEAVRQRLQGQNLSNKDKVMAARMILDSMIDRILIVQDAHRIVKKDKQWEQLKQEFDKAWREQELPVMLRKSGCANEYELKKKMSERGLSLDAMREEFRTSQMAREFMLSRIKPLVSVSLNEMREYYNEHLKSFERPAQVTWREVSIEVEKYPNRAEARRKAEAVLERLRHGDDFAKVAQTDSDGPNRTEGGKWKTAPGAYVVPAVNDALGSLPLNQVSSIIEGPSSFHIVRVEERRAPGPARFDEVQDVVQQTIFEAKYEREVKAYIKKLREKAVVRTIFDQPGMDLENRTALSQKK